MKTAVGLWIDHRQAVIVSIVDDAANIHRIGSNVEGHHRESGTSGPADDARQREMTEHLNSYYEEVVSRIRDAESILIFGPGEAKGELKARLEKAKLGGHVVGLETSDKLTDRRSWRKSVATTSTIERERVRGRIPIHLLESWVAGDRQGETSPASLRTSGRGAGSALHYME